MTTTRKRRPRAKPALPVLSVEERLLLAMEGLVEKGQSFATVTVEKLAKEAGISRATFYLHFADKAELVTTLLGRLTDEVVGSAGLWFRVDEGKPNPDYLKQGLTGIIQTFKKHHAILEAVAATANQDKTVAQTYEQMMAQLCAQSRRTVLAIQDGIDTGVDPDMLADVLTWVIELYCARFIGRYSEQQVEALINTFAHISHRAIFVAAD